MRRSRASLLAIIMTLGTILAGCTEAPPPPAPEPDPGPTLAQFADCPWTYHDGSAVDCAAEPPKLTLEPTLPTGWVCLGEDQREGWSFHWDPVSDERGIYYQIESNATDLGGVLRFKTNEEITLFTWDNVTTSGFLRVPVTYGDNATFRFLIYHIGYSWNGTALQGAAADEVWSLHDDQFWVVNRLATGNATYHFQGMQSTNSTIRTAEGERKVSFHEPATYFVRGQDFHFSAVYESIHFGRALQGIDMLGIDRQCQLANTAP